VRALITGASQGIGAATARKLGAPGEVLHLHYRTHRAEAEALAEELRARGARAFVEAADFAHPAEVERLAERIRHGAQPLDLLILNAGSYPRGAFETLRPGELESILQVNLVAPALLVRALLPALRASSKPRIVFVSSILAFIGTPHGAAYAAAKAGIVGLARSLALELAPSIAVNVVAPGPIDTAILASDTPATRREREARLPLRRVGTAEEVADAIAFLASPAASFITGTTLHVNGGAYLP
jgi:3-oxoacyl-[acyl-carrier protein] reductase